MSNSFTIPKGSYDAFLDVIEMGPEKLEQLTRQVADRTLTLDTSELASELGKAIEFSSDRVERVLYSVLIPLNSLRAAFRMSPGDFLHLLADLIERQNKGWHDQHGKRWSQVAS